MDQRFCAIAACVRLALWCSGNSAAVHIGYVRTMAAAAAAFLELQGRKSLTAPVRAII